MVESNGNLEEWYKAIVNTLSLNQQLNIQYAYYYYNWMEEKNEKKAL